MDLLGSLNKRVCGGCGLSGHNRRTCSVTSSKPAAAPVEAKAKVRERDPDAMAEDFPLAWPVGKPRTPRDRRARARFASGKVQRQALTRTEGVKRLHTELKMLGAVGVVVSSNVPVKNNGMIYGSGAEPDDTGIAIYFRLENEAHCLACDRWDTVGDNCAAIAAHIDAIRGQARWGVGDLAAAFAGYRALTAMGGIKPWWDILGFKEPPSGPDVVKQKWIELAGYSHPDKGGTHSQAAEINAAWGEAQKFYRTQKGKEGPVL